MTRLDRGFERYLIHSATTDSYVYIIVITIYLVTSSKLWTATFHLSLTRDHVLRFFYNFWSYIGYNTGVVQKREHFETDFL